MCSVELGLRLVPDGENLALYDLRTGERLLNYDELHESHEEIQQELEDERRQRAELQAQIAALRAAKGNSTR
ncbi:MAG: hypothetical protein HYR84_09010 [Planctomycetes bacterium]|nr:hypothetical protein [Planctomycetota bacterium]